MNSHEATESLANKTTDFHAPEVRARARVTSRELIGAAIEVHRQLGPGLLESIYQACLSQELTLRGIRHQKEVPFPVIYKGIQLDLGLRVDLVVDDLVIAELKSVRQVDPVHQLQLLTYLRLTRRWLGLLINFNSTHLKYGLQRVLNG